ncbi:MAG: sigma-70 family RNA polymerase sigma factor [Bacteroidota bacterium]
MNLSNEEVIEEIQAGGARQEKMIRQVYDSCFPYVYKALQKHKLTEEQAIDAYSDAVVALRRNILNGKFRGDSKYSTFLYSIFFKRCLNAIRDAGTNKHVWDYELPLHLQDKEPGISRLLEVNEQWELLGTYLAKLGDKCKEVLLDALYYGFKMEEIAKRHGYKDAQSMRSKKHSCMKQLKKLISASPDGALFGPS